jgi:FkbM family methyltransferase
MLASNIKTVATRYGEMSYYADDLFIGASLALYGEYSELEVEFLRQIIKPGWTVLDVGANIGVLTLPFADMVGSDGKVHAFEPQPENFNLLERNTQQLSDRVQLHQLVVSDRYGEMIVPPLAAVPHKNYGGVELNKQIDFGGKVDMDTLDAVMLDSPVSFIKVDVEGMECEVLRGAKQLIERCRPILYVENDHAGRVDRSAELIGLIERYDYKVFTHSPHIFNPRNYNKAELLPQFNYRSLNILAIPTEQVVPYASIIAPLQPALPGRPRARRDVGAKSWAGVVRFGGIGDNLIAASVCKPLKDAGFMVEVITQTPNSVIFENNPYIDKLSVYEHKDWPQDPLAWQKVFVLRGKEYAKFVNLGHSVEVLHAAFPIQSAFWWPQEYRRKLLGGSYLESTHDLFGMPYVFDKLFWPTDQEIELAQQTKDKIGKGPIIGWCLNGTRVDKVYPQTPQTISRLIKEIGAQVVLIGGGEGDRADFPLAKQCLEMVTAQNGNHDGLHHAGGEGWPLRRSLSFTQSLDLMIGPDTGLMWGVAFEPMPKIMLHSHASVENITKHWLNTTSLHADPERVPCWPCHRLHTDLETCRVNQWGNGAACISDISADLVLKTAVKLLSP